ncbi:transcription-repair coupling factor [Gallalistipes aquisgranensis]|uniref:transcription-repair coupling factor n=1 Tax=Gallalistipes aquisgranensis TaxID=2779358 RepID=UPI001CF89F6D|nr:transcription-repair coupling factor [Gallalistipes aquisgranensis]MBE5034287.1 transcription-repair coupling factor [Gallalistipes aquisgranensis]
MSPQQVNDLVGQLPGVKEISEHYEGCATVSLGSLVGSAFSLVAASVVRERGGVHVFVMEDRDAAAYLSSDFYQLLDADRVLFFPTGYKRSIQFGQEDPSGIVQRTAALNAVKNFGGEGYLVLCTYPEALAEKVVGMEELRRTVLQVGVGDRLSPAFVEETLAGYGFQRVDFVYEPGQYSVRGGIVDIFSYSENHPFRLDFFGDEVESIRRFEIASQLSVEKLQCAEIVPNLKRDDLVPDRVSFPRFAGRATYWVADPDYLFKRLNDIRSKILKELEEPSEIDALVTGRKGFAEDVSACRMFLLKDNAKERAADRKIEFRTAPQPRFNKNFELLAADINANRLKGYRTLILSDNKAQIERLQNIFHSIGQRDVAFEALPLTLHEGFVSHDLRLCFYTDHQIFDRYHRYRLRGELDRSESLTVAELNELKVGDYVVHIDHGVGRFGGLVRTEENGKVQEAIKLVYRDNDVLLVNVHALHRISRYKDRDSEPPKIYKLGSGAWQRMKAATKKAVKEIARELIALYARRKATPGFAFSPDSYLQHELEASFIYEDTPDQQKATEAVKHDMESPQPMDRLICGDVGFGKTEIAIRAAFKAVSDSRQVAVLVPTTILALQHYRSFSERLRDFPVRIEHLSRSKSAKETAQVLKELEEGKIDILIGTHKILGKNVRFKSLGLLVIDEEQKFGVAAKEKLRQMSVSVDTLTLTATPIPRTLQFSLMGSRDLSVISTPPPNRQPIVTESYTFDEQIIKEAVDYELGRGGQVYFVHNRVEDILQIEAMIRRLCPGVRTVVGHGQMDPKQLEKVVMDFIFGEYDVLVATTIVENGIDIPNANTIIINNAQNFGLSDLHQLRGRVGRSNRKAFCYLLSPPDELLTGEARRRLRALEEFSDLGSGFNIAMQDLDIRGAGNLLGAEQSGFIADIGFETYQKILNEAMEELRAERLVGDGTLPEGATAPAPAAFPAAPVSYVNDCQIEVDSEALIPDGYVGQSAEKIRLYRELDNITDEETLRKFEANLTDRFGPVPEQTRTLFHVIRLRWVCMKLGFERAKVKNGLLILQFIADTSSPYYKTPFFMALLKTVTAGGAKFVFRQNNNKLGLTVRDVKGVEDAWKTLGRLEAEAEEVQ